MSKNSNFNELFKASQVPPNGGLTTTITTENTIVITPPPPAKSLQEALDRGLSTFEHTSQYGRTYTIDVERALRCRRQLQVQNSNHTPRALEEPTRRELDSISETGRTPPPRLDPIARRRQELEREREQDRRREEAFKRLDPKVREDYLRSIDIELKSFHAQWKRKWEEERAELEGLLREGTDGCYTDSYWRAHGLEPPKKEHEEEEEEEEIDLGYSDTSDDTDITEEEVITIDE